MNVGNKSGDSYMLVCICCGSESELNQVAHRNTLGQVTGYIFSCADCFNKVQGSDYNGSLKVVNLVIGGIEDESYKV